MRAIEFRCFDKQNNKMFYQYSQEISDYYDVKLGERIEPRVMAIGRRDDSLMQWTGLLDRNEVNIFEGDIIKTSRFDCPLVVQWDYDQWGLFWTICNELSIDTQYDEVIGNIYSNPELLEPKE
jgi:hypothetical protein